MSRTTSGRYQRCPLGEKCPGSGWHIPNSATLNMHTAQANGSASSSYSSAKSASKDFSQASKETSPNSDAVISDDGESLSFAHIKDKKERSQALQEELTEGMANLAIDEEKFNEYIDFIKTGYNYSLRNQILLKMQKPYGGDFKTYKQWKALGYQVKSGSRSAYVLRPNLVEKEVTDKDGNPVMGKDGKTEKRKVLVGYTSYGVFSDKDLDESVKTPPSNPIEEHYNRYMNDDSIDDVQALREDVQKVAGSIGASISIVRKEDDSTLSGGANGYARKSDDGKGYEIVISSDSSEHAQTATMAHEIGHIMCGHLDDDKRDYGDYEHRGQMEVEAESIAYALGRDYGLDMGNRSFAYLKGWAGDDPKKVEQAMGSVAKALNKYYGSLEKILTGSNKNETNSLANQETKKKRQKRRSAGRGKKGRK